jgi:hypothetical protein
MFTNSQKAIRLLSVFSAISIAFTIKTQAVHALVVMPVVAVGLVHIIVALAGFLVVPTTFVVKILTKHKLLKSAVIAFGIMAAVLVIVLIAMKLYLVLSK